jgi:hypothetical protein
MPLAVFIFRLWLACLTLVLFDLSFLFERFLQKCHVYHSLVEGFLEFLETSVPKWDTHGVSLIDLGYCGIGEFWGESGGSLTRFAGSGWA